MKTQQDSPVRMLALDNLRAMCETASGMCHRYWIEKVSRSRVHIGYSNPDEWANENPMYAVLPCFPSSWQQDRGNPRVLVEIMRVINDTWDGEGWQAFDPLWDQYATRGTGDDWAVIACDSMGAASRAAMVTQHVAYHDKFDGGKRCDVCKSPDVIPSESIAIVLELARENTIDKSSSYVENDMGDIAAKQNAAIDALDNFVNTVAE